MALLLNHLEQISSSARTIGELPFPPPKIFTNALLGNHEITTLIRDTEPHERALFSAEPSAKAVPVQRRSARRTTAFSSEESRRPGSLTALPRKQSAMAGLLGSHLLQEIGGYGEDDRDRKLKGEGGVNVEVLLQGAEKLCTVYPVAGALGKITSLRNRFNQVAESVAVCEVKVTTQTSQLDRMNKVLAHGQDHDEEDEEVTEILHEVAPITEEDLRAEEQEIQELEQKKRALEERVASMEKDLDGLLR